MSQSEPTGNSSIDPLPAALEENNGANLMVESRVRSSKRVDGIDENHPTPLPVLRIPALGAAIGFFLLGAIGWIVANLSLVLFCLVVGIIALVIAAPRSPTLPIMVAMLITGPLMGLFVTIGVGLSQADPEVAALYGLDWLVGGASVAGAMAAIVARLLRSRVGYLGRLVIGAALGFLIWEVVAWPRGWGIWSNLRVSPDYLSPFGSFALMILGVVLGLGSGIRRKT